MLCTFKCVLYPLHHFNIFWCYRPLLKLTCDQLPRVFEYELSNHETPLIQQVSWISEYFSLSENFHILELSLKQHAFWFSPGVCICCVQIASRFSRFMESNQPSSTYTSLLDPYREMSAEFAVPTERGFQGGTLILTKPTVPPFPSACNIFWSSSGIHFFNFIPLPSSCPWNNSLAIVR